MSIPNGSFTKRSRPDPRAFLSYATSRSLTKATTLLLGQLALVSCSGELGGGQTNAGASGEMPSAMAPFPMGSAEGVVPESGAPDGSVTVPGPGQDPAVSTPDPMSSEGGVGPDPSVVGPEPEEPGNPQTPVDDDVPVPALDCTEPQAAPARLRALSETQYSNTILDLFQVDGAPGDGLGLGVDDVSLEMRMNVAAQVATEAVARLLEWAPCTPAPEEDAAACADQIIDEVGTRAFRRPLSDTERTHLSTLFEAGLTANGFATGVEWFITGLLQSPDFMYEVVRPSPTEQVGQVLPLAPYEYASRLAYFIWDGPPDDELSNAALNGDLDDPTQRAAQIVRLLENDRSTRGVSQFYSHWLPLSGFAELARDADGFDASVVAALRESLLMSVEDIYSAPNPNIESLFSGDSYFLNDVLRDFYGLAGEGTDFTPTPMAGEGRRGLLTHPAVMALLARPQESNPISRGLFLLRNVLCVDIPPPPATLEIADLPPVADGVSTRERLEMHVADPVCAACHQMIDPAGFAFEAFDEVGRYRSIDHGRQVDSSGSIVLNADIDGPFASGDEFLAKFAESQSVRECFVEHYLDYALTRSRPEAADACSLQAIRTSFANGDLEQLIMSVATSDSFRLRIAEGVAQ